MIHSFCDFSLVLPFVFLPIFLAFAIVVVLASNNLSTSCPCVPPEAHDNVLKRQCA